MLVLGAPPELVDLAVQRRAGRVITMDWNGAMFAAMRCLGREDWAQVENLVCNWCTFVPELEGAIDLVLGDSPLTLIPFPQDWKEVFRVLQRYLVTEGHVIMRLAVQPEKPLDFSPYLGRTLARFDAECAGANPDQRVTMLRELIAEVRFAMAFASADASGAVDLDRRAALSGLLHTELTARCGHWKEWESLQTSLQSETEIRKGLRDSGKGMPSWESALLLMEGCGFCIRHVEYSGVRPVPGVFRVFGAERI